MRKRKDEFVLCASFPVGAPQYIRTTLIGDVFTKRGRRHGESSVFGVQIDFRRRVTRRIVVELAGPAASPSVFMNTGVSVEF